MTNHLGIVATGHRLSAQAADHILRDGGNAFDAALAGLAAACVAEPFLASLGGGGYMLAKPAGQPARVYDFFAHTPRQRCPENEMDFFPVLATFEGDAKEVLIGRGSVAVPGVIRGLFDIHRDLATRPMTVLMEPAIDLAIDGYEINRFQGEQIKQFKNIFTLTPEATSLFGSPTQPAELLGSGDRIVLPELADVMDALARESADLFYRGEIGKTFSDDMEQGGHIKREDLERYQVALTHPLTFDYGDIRLHTTPTPAYGGLLLAFALKLLASETSNRPSFGSSAHLGLLAHILGLTERARIESAIGKPGSDPAVEQLLDPDYFDLWVQRVHRHPVFSRGSTHISVIDAHLNVASLSVSNGEGSAYIIPGTGISLNNMLGEEALNGEGFNRWRLDKRLSSMLSPTIGSYQNGDLLCTGSGGSSRILSAILQVLVNMLDYGMSCEEAVSAPRLHYEAGVLSLEEGFDLERIGTLLDVYQEHQFFGELDEAFGGAHTVAATTGTDPTKVDYLSGLGDPRRSGAAILV